jgi:hypothetical protein
MKSNKELKNQFEPLFQQLADAKTKDEKLTALKNKAYAIMAKVKERKLVKKNIDFILKEMVINAVGNYLNEGAEYTDLHRLYKDYLGLTEYGMNIDELAYAIINSDVYAAWEVDLKEESNETQLEILRGDFESLEEAIKEANLLEILERLTHYL